ncbi:hypothetical protein JXB27_02235 [Candidatus Woesearchaeota archaeon]|nr:hypothetical protein [Candidatus Woesearchaeota archaeon]
MKKRLTQEQEFQIMKLVLDKFLWLGIGVMLFGLYQTINNQMTQGISWIVAGAFVLVLFIIMIIKHYEISP